MTENKDRPPEGIDILRVIRGVYETLKSPHELYGLVFSPYVISEVLVSTKDPRVRGTIEYEDGSIIRIKNTFWALLYGIGAGNYVNNFVVNDISVVSITENVDEIEEIGHDGLCEKIHLLMKKSGDYFWLSLLHGEHTGNVHLSPQSDNIFRKALLEKIGGQFSRFVLQEFRYDGNLIDITTGKRRVAQTIIWKPGVVEFLSGIIEETLLEFS